MSGARTGVLLLARELDLGGTERQLSEVARALNPSRFDVHVGCFRSGGMRAREIEAAGIPLVRFPLTSFKSPRRVWASITALRRYTQDHRVDIVHAFDPPAVLFGALARPFLPRAAVLSSQRCFREVGSAFRQRLLYVADACTHGVVVNCDALRRHRADVAGAPRLPVHLCYNGLDTRRFRRLSSLPRPPAFPPDTIIIGTACGLRPEKGLPTLVAAFARLRLTLNVGLLIVGDGTERAALEAQARALGVFDRCHFQPKAADVVPWLSVMDIFVLPSGANEALSNSLMEAMACGCACVASNIGGNPELIKDGATGLLFPANDDRALGDRLMRLVVEPALRRTLAQAAVESVSAQFTLEASAGRMAQIYEATLARRTTGSREDRFPSLDRMPSTHGRATL